MSLISLLWPHLASAPLQIFLRNLVQPAPGSADHGVNMRSTTESPDVRSLSILFSSKNPLHHRVFRYFVRKLVRTDQISRNQVLYIVRHHGLGSSGVDRASLD